MIKNLLVKNTLIIKANPAQVWDALVSPEKIKLYLFGTETLSDWKVGSSIVFQGEYEGHKYKDKGVILEIRKKHLLRYSYWSGFSGLEDKEENYATVTYRLNAMDGETELTVTQQGFASEDAQKHSENAWAAVLENIAKIVEEKN